MDVEGVQFALVYKAIILLYKYVYVCLDYNSKRGSA